MDLGKTIQSVHIKRDNDYNNQIVSMFFMIDNNILVFDVDQETDTIIPGNSISISKGFYKEEIMLNRLLKKSFFLVSC